MHIVFGMMADGFTYPDFPGDGDGLLDGCIVGPLGLLDILETKLGLGGPPVTPVVRISAWQKKLKLASKGAKPFWSDSLAADPFSTARLILSWRDTLVEAGWKPDSLKHAPPRLLDMAAAEAADDPMPPGRADRLRTVIASLEIGNKVDIGIVETVEELEGLPPGWRRLMDLLAASGTDVRQKIIQSPVEASSDLGRLHVFLKRAKGVEPYAVLEGDASVVELNAATEITAAEAVAEWIASGQDSDEGRTVIIAQTGSTAVLDLSLSRLGQPELGISAASPFRGALQVLTLAFATVWKPFDAERFLDLLTLPNPPMRWAPGQFLANAVSRQPGIDGPEWKRAWQQIDDWIQRKTEGDKRKSAKLKEDIQAWAEVARFVDTMPAVDAKRIADRVRKWASTLAGEERDPLLMCVVGAAKALSDAMTKLDETPISRRQIEQMIDASIAEGLGNPAHRAQASRLRAVSHPGAICGPVRRVVWWNFAGHEPSSPPFPWYQAELSALEAAGCCPERPSDAARLQTAYWTNAALAAGQGVLFVRPARIAGTEVGSHPFAHLLSPLFGSGAQRRKITVRAESVLESETIEIAKRTINRQPDEVRDLPRGQASWAVPSLDEIFAERTESPTSLDTLSTCHLKWLFKHVAELSAGRIRSIPEDGQLLGNIAHMIAQEIFVPGAAPSGVQARQHAERIFDRVVQEIGTPLLKPGSAGDLAFARERIPKALETLALLISRDGWEIVGAEMKVEHDFGNGLKVKGITDLRVRHPVHDTGIIDLKWSKRDKRRREEIEEGRAVQITTYAHTVEPGKSLAAGYFLLSQGMMLAEDGSPLAGEPIKADRNLADTWDAVVSMHRGWADMALSGTAIASGVKGAPVPDGVVLIPPKKPCEYCDYGVLCRVPKDQ